MGSFCAANIPIVSAWTESLLKNTSIAEPGGLHLTVAGLHSYQDSLPSDVTPYFSRAQWGLHCMWKPEGGVGRSTAAGKLRLLSGAAQPWLALLPGLERKEPSWCLPLVPPSSGWKP